MKKIIIATGGTGGHIYPALALAQIWKEQQPDTEIVFIGNDDRMEAQIVPEAGYRFLPVHASGFTGSVMNKVKAVARMLASASKIKGYLKAEKPDLLIGFGGYVTASAAMAAKSLHIPFMLHEQNSVIGKANRLVAKDAAGIVTCYQKAQQDFGLPQTRLLGNPRATLAARVKKDEDYFSTLGLDPTKKTILIVMGSLGSASVNSLMKTALSKVDPNLQIVYVCGKDNAGALHDFDEMPNVHTAGYVDALRLYGMLDGMVCRAGATTLAELTALGIPAVIIPSPYVTENHQFYNAKMLTDQNAAVMLEEKDLNADSLSKAIHDAFLDEEHRLQLMDNARAMGKPRAAEDIVEWADEIIRLSKRSQ